MKKVWFPILPDAETRRICAKGTPVLVDGDWDCAYPYLYAIGDRQPMSRLIARVEKVDLRPMLFDEKALRYREVEGRRVWRVCANSPGDIPKLRDMLIERGYSVSQSYIKFALRVSGDTNLKSGPPDIPKAVLEAVQRTPRILAFDVEEVGSVAYVGYTTNGVDVDIIKVRRDTRLPPSELPGDVDYAAGYNVFKIDVKYLPMVGRYVVDASGRFVPLIDLYLLFTGGFGGALGKVESSEGLYDVARQLGIHVELGKSDVELLRIKRKRAKLGQLDEEEVERYLGMDVLVTYRLAARVIPILEGLGAAVGGDALTIAQVGEDASPGHLMEFLIHKKMERLGFVLGDRKRKWAYAAGDKVKVRAVGVFRNVAEYDFSAMYPSLIAQYGVDPTSLKECADGYEIALGEGRDGKELAVKMRRRICFEGGPIWELHVTVLEARKAVKKVSKAADQAVKILANSGYGIYGKSNGFGIINEGVAAYIAQLSLAVFEDLWNKFSPVYGDTDSTYIPLNGQDPERLLEEINSYVADKWRGPHGSRLEMKLEGVWDIFFVPPAESGRPAEKHYVKIRGNEIIIKGAALKPHTLPAFLRYGGYYHWAKVITTEAVTLGEASSLSTLLAQIRELPIEDLFVEKSFSLRDFFYTDDGKPISTIDASRQPIAAWLAYKYGRVVARFSGREISVEPKLDLDAIDTVWYLPVVSRDKVYTYYLLADGRPVEVVFYAAVDSRLRRVDVERRAVHPISEEQVRDRAKAVVLDHKFFKYFAQSRL